MKLTRNLRKSPCGDEIAIERRVAAAERKVKGALNNVGPVPKIAAEIISAPHEF